MNLRFGRFSLLVLVALLAVCTLAPRTARLSAGDKLPAPPGLISQGRLEPPMPSEFARLKFSPDGKFILAQNVSTIFVLTREPLAVHFRIDAPDAGPAQFTPDSSEVVFSTSGMRPSVERWSVASGEHTFEKALILVGGCVESRLSPDAKTFACFSEHPYAPYRIMPYPCRRGIFDGPFSRSDCARSYPGLSGPSPAPGSEADIDFELIDVRTGDIVAEKRAFIPWDVENVGFLVAAKRIDKLGIGSLISIIPANFSPDGRYFAAGFRKHGIAVELASHKLIPLAGDLDHMLGGGFAFVSAEQVLAENQADPSKSEVLDFPSGLVSSTIPLGDQQIDGVTRGRYAVFRPIKVASVGVFDLESHKMLAAMPEPTGVDVWDGHLVAQLPDGQIVLTNVADSKAEGEIALPTGDLGNIEVASVSADLRWLAVSTVGRGAVWDLSESQKRYLFHAFQGAYFEGDSALYADFPRLGDRPRSIGRTDLATFKGTSAHTVDETALETKQYERYLISEIGSDKHSAKPTLVVQDARDGRTLWTRTFTAETPEDFEISPDQNRFVLLWMAEQKPAMDEIKKDKLLKTMYGKMGDHVNTVLLQVLEAETGNPVGNVLVDTSSQASVGGDVQRMRVRVFGDRLFATLGDKTRVYSVTTSELRTTVSGPIVTVSVPAGLFALRSRDSALELRSLADSEKRSRLALPSEIAFVHFSDDGKRLFVLTRDQKFSIFDAEALARLVAVQAVQ
jgi:hypothetical protein